MPEKISRLHKPFYRNGPEHRAGADVSFTDIVKVFGFRTVTIGKWVTAAEQQIAANLLFDALSDLMDILQVPTPVISLNGSLSLAFGAGGKKFSCAHYDSATRKLALAKNAGGGALAHEWFHAFDHYICTKAFLPSKNHQFASDAWLNHLPAIEHKLNIRLFNCFETLFLAEGGEQPNAYVQRSVQIDQGMGSYYFARPQELAARAFEACIQDHPRKNAFLVQGTKQSNEARLGIYPDQTLRTKLQRHFLDYFAVLGQAVASKN